MAVIDVLGDYFGVRCILDAREEINDEGVYNALIHHIKYATNDGKYKEIPREEVKKCQLNTQNTLFHHLIPREEVKKCQLNTQNTLFHHLE